jgi:hypothetical protein
MLLGRFCAFSTVPTVAAAALPAVLFVFLMILMQYHIHAIYFLSAPVAVFTFF